MQYQERLLIHKETLPFLNVSMYMNDIKPIQSLTIENVTENDIQSVNVRIASDIPCIEPFGYNVSMIPAHTELKIPLNSLDINRDFFHQLSETEKALITIEVLHEETSAAKETLSINILPLSQFGGLQVLPELIASFITPNHPFVYYIKRKAAKIQEKQGIKVGFEGYQSNDPERVLQIVSSIFYAIRSEEIVYSSLPPGYEETGQRLRLLSTIEKERFGNCIDISLLFAACLEAIDLNPLIIVVSGHAFVGCWLHDNKFAEIINDDKAAITKRLAKGIREMVVFEAISVCKGKNIPFAEAIDIGESQIVEHEDFLLSVDIKCARVMRIRPLPLHTNGGETQIDHTQIRPESKIEMEKNFHLGEIYKEELVEDTQVTTKQKIWERNLLDLSLRNNLLNLRMTRSMLQLVDIDINHLEDTLYEGKSFSILPNLQVDVLRKYSQFHPPVHHSSPLYQMANEELKYKRLLSHYHQQDLNNILTHIFRNSRNAIEENGFSTLYLAVGLLKWYDIKTPDQPRYAPVLLLPVEINRRSVNSNFSLKSREEETMINITLLEFFRQEYDLNLNSLEKLPTDDKGVDVARVMGILRRAILHLKGWDVTEQVVLGNFSFSKLILWQDMVSNNQQLMKSQMVKSLVEGKLVFGNTQDENREVDFNNIPSDSLLLPIPADISQTDAVLTAQKGESFILHGPPGTGKSQTITNIIADALYRGKKVLFVAAKKAALDVVHKRLEQIGLAPFSLELHSNKSKKSDVLMQLAQSLETAKLQSTNNFVTEAQRLDNAKKEISQYVNILHKTQKVGWSLYDSIMELERYRNKNIPRNTISSKVIKDLNPHLWQQWEDWLPKFIAATRLIVHPSENPLYPFNLENYSPSINETLAEQTQILITLLPNLQDRSNEVCQAIHLPFSIDNRAEWEYFRNLILVLKELPDMHLDLLKFLSDKQRFSVYEEWYSAFSKYLEVLNTILADFNRNILDTNVFDTELQWKKAQQSWFLLRWLQKRKIKKYLSLYSNRPLNDDTQVESLFTHHYLLQEYITLLKENRYVNLQKAMGNLYKGENTQMEEIAQKAAAAKLVNEAVNHWQQQGAEKWINNLQQKDLVYSDDIITSCNKQIEEFLKLCQSFDLQSSQFREVAGFFPLNHINWIGETTAQLQNILAHLSELKKWLIYIRLRNEGQVLNLQWFIDSYENKGFNNGEIIDYFYFTVHFNIVQTNMLEHELLSLFNGQLFEQKIEQYKRLAKHFRFLSMQELRIKLAAQVPNTMYDAMQSSELGILQKAIKSRGRGMSIRKLFEQIPTLLPRIAPCMLMSPISAAQYFDTDTNHFDMVIFDEASQLPTCEAVSALARAKQAIIVGDPKQMPPTSFFNTIKMDEENLDMEDLESILDDCLSLSFPSKYLLRHYRSRHESLIAFSNVNYYENKLLTFPSADDLSRKVKYHQCEGFYDKGKSRTNKFEADAIVDFIQNHYSNPDSRRKSVGVVTFSQAQQNLVEEKLQEFFILHPVLEEYTLESEEPLFVKNLENVQGDERDIILFSVGYAPDEMGKMSMNFGPLNRNGGWRRLNVAITRARYEMHLFSTLKADQINLNRTSAQGVAGLKAFLQFAEKGHLTIRPEDIHEAQSQKHLSEAISNQLRLNGLNVKCNIGTSGFKLDVGIIHPQKPGHYIMGILVDGHYYYQARTANDRETVLPEVLKALGWKIYRIWTVDWYENMQQIIDDILRKVKTLQTQKEEKIDLQPQKLKSFDVQNISPTVKEYDHPPSKQKPYEAYVLETVENGDSETIFEFQRKNLIKQQISALVENESPISKKTLYRKVLHAWNIIRLGARLERYMDEITFEMRLLYSSHHQLFFWSEKSDLKMDFYRDNSTEKRNIEDIAPEEIVVALQEAIEQNISIEESDIIRYLARTFGFAKVGKQIEPFLQYAIKLAEQKGLVKSENGRVKVVD